MTLWATGHSPIQPCNLTSFKKKNCSCGDILFFLSVREFVWSGRRLVGATRRRRREKARGAPDNRKSTTTDDIHGEALDDALARLLRWSHETAEARCRLPQRTAKSSDAATRLWWTGRIGLTANEDTSARASVSVAGCPARQLHHRPVSTTLLKSDDRGSLARLLHPGYHPCRCLFFVNHLRRLARRLFFSLPVSVPSSSSHSLPCSLQ